MKIQFLETSQPGLSWMISYYEDNPQLDRDRAFLNFDSALEYMKDHPRKKETFGGFSDVWEKKINYTAYSFLYTIRNSTIFVIDVRDQRGHRSAEALRYFKIELARKYGL